MDCSSDNAAGTCHHVRLRFSEHCSRRRVYRQLAVWSGLCCDQLFNHRHSAGDRSIEVGHEINVVITAVQYVKGRLGLMQFQPWDLNGIQSSQQPESDRHFNTWLFKNI